MPAVGTQVWQPAKPAKTRPSPSVATLCQRRVAFMSRLSLYEWRGPLDWANRVRRSMISSGCIGWAVARNLLDLPAAPGTMAVRNDERGTMTQARDAPFVVPRSSFRVCRWGESVSTVLRHNGELPRPQLPLILCWEDATQPLPMREVRAPGRVRPRLPQAEAPAWLPTGCIDHPFDFGGHVRRLCEDIASRCAELHHVDVSRLLIGATQARSGRPYGLQARVTPLRFRGGSLTRQRRGIFYQVQRYFVGNREMLYLMTFCLPRFLDQGFDDKFITLFHELYHISPDFDGDLRRHQGRYCIHSHSQRGYDEHMGQLAREYLAGNPDPALHAFLRLDFGQLYKRHGSVVGVVVPRPKLIPVPSVK